MSASEGQEFILEKQASSFSSAAHGCASPPPPPPPPFLPGCSQPSWWPCPQPWGTVSLCPCWQQSSWHRRVKLEVLSSSQPHCGAFLLENFGFSSFPHFSSSTPSLKCFVGSQNTCSVNSDPGGKLAEMSLLGWNDDFVFKLQVDRIPPVSPESPCFRNYLGCGSLCPLSWLPEGAISQPAFPSCFQEVPVSLPELCSSCWMKNSIPWLCQLSFLPHPAL